MPTQVVTQAIAGPFRATYTPPTGSTVTGASLGVIGEKGIKQIREFSGEDYTGDLLGNTVIESVYMGGNMFLEFDLEEANWNVVKALMNPFRVGDLGGAASEADPDPMNYVGIPGTFASSYCGSLVLNPLYSATGGSLINTTAGGQTTPVRTYGLVTLPANFNMEQSLSSKRRIIPIRLRCFPYLGSSGDATKYIWYSLGALDATYRVN